MHLYAIFDKANERYVRVFDCPTDIEALDLFQDYVLSLGCAVEDYILNRLGAFNVNTGFVHSFCDQVYPSN